MGLYNIDRPIHRIFAVFSSLVGMCSLLNAIVTILERRGIWIPIFVVLTFVSILFIVSSVALFRGRNWGRLLLSFLLHGLIIGITILLTLVIKDFINDKEILGVLQALGIFLVPILTYIVLIVILHSKHLKGELLHKKMDEV